MSQPSSFDPVPAHRFFSATCFNRTWDLMDLGSRSAEQDDEMLFACAASMWHWLQRADRTPRNLSVGYWQLSRICSLLSYSDLALRFATTCIEHSQSEPPFYLGYGHEAAARAYFVGNDRAKSKSHLEQAEKLASEVSDEEERTILEADIKKLREQIAF